MINPIIVPFPFSATSAIVSTSIVLTIFIIHRLATTLFFHPLASLPGPWYAAISDAWFQSQVLLFQRCKAIHPLFAKYGPVVRVGPNRVVFCDVETMKLVYNVHKFDKGVFYQAFKVDGHNQAMSTLEHGPHTIVRRSFAPHYSPSNLARFHPEIHGYVVELIETIHHIGGKQPIEAMQLFRQLMVDMVGVTAYGHHIGALSKWDIGVEHPISAAVSDFPKRASLRSSMPGWLWFLACRWPNPRWQQFCRADIIIRDFISSRIRDIRAKQVSSALGTNTESESDEGGDHVSGRPRIPLLERLLNYKYPGGVQMPDSDVISESSGHTVAGVDTSSTSLAFFFWQITRQPDVSRKLQMEIDDAMPDSRVLPEVQVMFRLPYVNAFIKEGLRLYGAVPALLERVVPPTTTKSGLTISGFDMLGYSLPPGTLVATQSWSLHRDPIIFPHPENFNPDRWLTASPEHLQQMDRALIPFGSGARICGGANIANIMLRMVVCAVVRNFEVMAPEWMNDEFMSMRDGFNMFPVGSKCDIIFLPRRR